MKHRDQTVKLRNILNQVFRFHYNVGTGPILKAVYGEESDEGYLESKADQITRRGFESWFCDLDLENQIVVAEMMLERYPDLREVL